MSPTNAARLLIADDDPEMLAVYTAFFCDQGFDVRTAMNGVDALAEYRAWYPAAVLLDIEMPLFDGLRVARAIRLVQAVPIPVLVAVSGLMSQSERDESMSAGFDHYFVKPTLMPIILAAMNLGLAPNWT